MRTIYVFENEALYEASNDTIHLMLHIGVIESGATLAVYIKSRGAFSRAYMAAIGPAQARSRVAVRTIARAREAVGKGLSP